MTATYDLIASNVLSSSASSVTFSSIPATYRDLIVVFQKLNDNAQVHTRVNSDTGANYSYVLMRGNGSTATSGSGSGQTRWHFSDGADANSQGLLTINFLDYSATDKHKTVLARYGDAAAGTIAVAGRWANTSGITSIEVYATGASWNVGTSIYLYGIAS